MSGYIGWTTLEKQGIGKKVGRAAVNRTMALQADSLVPLSCYSAVAIMSNLTREYEPYFPMRPVSVAFATRHR